MGTVLALMELSRDREVLPSSLEALAVGKMIAEKVGLKLAALVMGGGIEQAAESLRAFPTDEVLVVDQPLLEVYQPELYTQAVEQVCSEIKPDYLVMGETFQSIDLAPRLAFALDSGLVTGCVDLEFDSGETLFIKPVYSGNVMAAYAVEGVPRLATFRSKSFEPAKPGESAPSPVRSLAISLDQSSVKIQAVEQVLSGNGHAQGLENAEIVVSGGRGLGGPEGFEILRELADQLGGALGASRPPCDLGWIEPSAQVGITGAIVAPDLYVAVGISGSTQHVGGMEGAKTIVAINDKEDAPIFKIADYGVAGDYKEVLPQLLEGLGRSK
ncbi:electron transfer flavoprotein subunit alpha/FixB family protein [Desulfatibacillum aliphaticivorans]|uniref:electron transfer flavoprotein subunit alpha/FixB family protein n=1 Tax=Desulfatibacillum aliphaticivorans TaxID=218208 RepID=UPI0003FA7F19|nr:electron transfer flavoprotein subunit alpha/FixB family protein [Desulfatibacillum aliphaticivorans]